MGTGIASWPNHRPVGPERQRGEHTGAFGGAGQQVAGGRPQAHRTEQGERHGVRHGPVGRRFSPAHRAGPTTRRISVSRAAH